MLSKGFCWCADSDDAALYWSHAGAMLEIDCLGRWWATLPQDRWPEEAVATILADFDDSNNSDNRVGDRLQELVFIGPRFGETRSQTLVGKCLAHVGRIPRVQDLGQGTTMCHLCQSTADEGRTLSVECPSQSANESRMGYRTNVVKGSSLPLENRIQISVS